MPLPSDHWQRALALMDTAVTLRPDERDLWLARMTAEEPLVAPLLQKLLSAHRRVETNDILATLPRQHRAQTKQTTGQTGAHIGPFELTDLLGHGGMGSVWRARYADGRMKRDVAVKLPATSDNPAALASLRERFARERDFLAQLEHPNIARLYDTGISDEGQPYLAMEYVAGEPIDSYCDKHRLPVKARLTLYLQVLDAVEFAHRQLVLHRDLKPGNVLVDASGQVRLLDFGVAKLLPQQAEGVTAANTPAAASASTDLTEMAGAAITLAYAAPEQINNGRLSTATDVYALGVMLYRLLTGSAPYQPKRDTRGALEDEVLTVVPTNASARFATLEALDARQSTEVALRRTLAGDIDTILAKALKKDPDERYPTVNAFAQDIERALHGYRVLAQPDSAWYRTRKFVQRHPWAVAVSSAGVATLMMVATVAVWQGSVARTQAALAEREADRAKAVQQFLVSLFQSAKPEQSRGKQLTVREVLDRNAPRIEAEFARQPETAAALAGEIGTIYQSLGDLDKAVSYLGRKVGLLAGLDQKKSVDYVDANERLGRYLVEADRYSEAEAPLTEALEWAAKIEPLARERRLHASMTMGLLRLETGKIAEARVILTAVHNEISALPEVTPKLQWLSDGHLATVLFAVGDFEQARKFHLRALERVRADSKAEIFAVTRYETNLAQSEFALRHLDEAERLYQSVTQTCTQLYGANSSETLFAKTGLARVIGAKGEYRRAVSLQNEVIAAATVNGEPGELARAQSFQIRNLIGDAQYAAARRLTELALSYFAGLQSGPSRYSERLRTLRAEIQFAMGELPNAEADARRSLANQEAIFEATSPQIAQTLDVLGAILRAQLRFAEATALHRRSHVIHVKAFGSTHVQALRSETYLAVARFGMGDGKALDDFSRASDALGKSLGSEHPALRQIARAAAWLEQPAHERTARGASSLFRLIDF